MKEEIEKIVEILRSGGIILYPTDTVWGIGCDATNSEAVERIYKLKRSEGKQGMVVLIDKADNVSRYFNKFPDVTWDILDMSDKPLTLILPNANGVSANLLAPDGSLGVRIPNHEFCRTLISRLGRPLVSTSANITGKAAPARLSEISKEISEGVDYTVSEKFQGSPTNRASSIIKLGEGGQVQIIRE